jgi:hypothetical protein
MTPRQQIRLNQTFARVKGESIEVLERAEEVLKEALKLLRTDDVELPRYLHSQMQLVTSALNKVLSGQQRVRGIREACRIMEGKP